MDVDLGHDPDRRRYEASQDGRVVSYIAYRLENSTMVVASTVTDPQHRGAGLAGRLTRFALDDARSRGWRVVPRCPYTADWIGRHPDYADLLA